MARILVAEDDELERDLIRRALETRDHSVTATADGAAALAALQSADPAFDLLLADIKMPVMDGIALALQTARDFPGTPILLMTGFADQKERAHGLDQLIADVIAKAVLGGGDQRGCGSGARGVSPPSVIPAYRPSFPRKRESRSCKYRLCHPAPGSPLSRG